MNKYIQDKLLEKHICRFNDGECNCDCYIAGMTDYHNHIIEKIQKDLDNGRFYEICSHENSFMKYMKSLLQDTNPKE
jgi:hypothetical protein